MKRSQLEHILRASAAITGADEFVIIGSQAILGQHPNPPAELTDDAELIDGSIGEASPFHQTFGYYAHGVGQEAATLPEGWKDRLVELRSNQTNSAVGLCLETRDLAVSKLVAGRPKDLAFLGALFQHGLASIETVRNRLTQTSLDSELRSQTEQRLERLITKR